MRSSSKNTALSPLSLERILGLSTLSNASFANSPTGDIYYSAGSVVVRYNPEGNKQKGFYNATKGVSSIALSLDGRYLAIGERGFNSSIVIYDTVKDQEVTVLTSHHKHGVGCLAFSPNSRYLVSIGFKHDRQLILWDWDVSHKVSTQKLGNKVNSVSFHNSGTFFVTAGDRHLKWWLLTEVIPGQTVLLEGKPASILEDLRNSVFMDVVCGSGSADSHTYCTTSTGVLCMFNNESRMVEKWVQLESDSSYCLELFAAEGTPGLLTVGCASGTVRCFSPSSLDYTATLPLPAPLPIASDESTLSHPACYAIRKVAGTKASPVPKLACVYADHSLFVWDISDIYIVAKYRSFLYHNACIWDIQFIEGQHALHSPAGSASSAVRPSLPPGSFVTCSTDHTVRVWNTDPRAQRESKFKSMYSREMLHSFTIPQVSDGRSGAPGTAFHSVNSTVSSMALSASHTGTTSAAGHPLDLSKGIPDVELPDRPPGPSIPRSLAVHPYGHQLAVGSKDGRLRVYDLQTMREKISTSAHAAEILTLHYSPPLVSVDGGRSWSVNVDTDGSGASGSNAGDEPMVLLASAGRDRLIHVYNASMDYSPIDTLDHHSASVTIVRFTSDGKKLISCGGDKNMVFSGVNGPEITKAKTIQTPNGAINGLAVETSNKFAVTSGQDKKLNVWNLQSGKNMRAYKSDSITQELYKTDIDPSGMYIATCAFDKSVSVFDFFSGELVAHVSSHSELVTGVRFTPDGQHLLTIGGDGCIMMWRVADFLVQNMQDRVAELLSQAQKRNNKFGAVSSGSTASGASVNTLPAPAPSAGNASFGLMPPAPPSIQETTPASSVQGSAASGAGKVNKWGAKKADPNSADAYELFGQKIIPALGEDSVANKGKYTVLLSETSFALDSAAVDSDSPEQKSKAVAAGSSVMSPSRLAHSIEDRDDVILSALSDDEGGVAFPAGVGRGPDSDDDDDSDGSHLFKPAADGGYESDFDKAEDERDKERDDAVERAGSRIDSLEKSAQHIENWLENVLRTDCMLDETVSTAAPKVTDDDSEPHVAGKKRNALDISASFAAQGTSFNDISAISHAADQSVDSSAADIMGRSLSSAFFKSLRTSKTADATGQHNHQALEIDPSVPPAVTRPVPMPSLQQGQLGGEALSGEDAANAAQEAKRRDRAATVARMKERMRVMGIEKARKAAEEAEGKNSREDGSADTQAEEEYADDTISGEDDDGDKNDSTGPEKTKHVSSAAVPHRPLSTVYEQTGSSAGSEDLVLEETSVMPADSVAALKASRNSPKRGDNRDRELRSPEEIALELKSKAESYKSILSELERAKQQAASSYQELMNLRTNLEESVQFSHTPRGGSSNSESFAQLSETQRGRLGNTSFNGGSSAFNHSRMSVTGGVGGDSAEVTMILERYSERLVELVSDKMLAKLNVSGSSNK